MPITEESSEEVINNAENNKSLLIKINNSSFYMKCLLMKNQNWRVQILNDKGKVAPLSRSLSKDELKKLYCQIGSVFNCKNKEGLRKKIKKSKEIIKKIKICQAKKKKKKK